MESTNKYRTRSDALNPPAIADKAPAHALDGSHMLKVAGNVTVSPATSLTEHDDRHSHGKTTSTTANASPTPRSQRTSSSYESRVCVCDGPRVEPDLSPVSPSNADVTAAHRRCPAALRRATSGREINPREGEGEAGNFAEEGTDDGYRSSSERTTPRVGGLNSLEGHSLSSSVSLSDWRGAANPAAWPRSQSQSGTTPLISLKGSPRSPSSLTMSTSAVLAHAPAADTHFDKPQRTSPRPRPNVFWSTCARPLRAAEDPTSPDLYSGLTTVCDDLLSFSVPLQLQRTSRLSMQLSSSSSAVGGHHVTLTQGATFLKQSSSRREERFYEAIQTAQETLVEAAVRHTPAVLRAFQRRQQQQQLSHEEMGAEQGCRHQSSPPLQEDKEGDETKSTCLTRDGDPRARATRLPVDHESGDTSSHGTRWWRGYLALTRQDAAAADAALPLSQSPRRLSPLSTSEAVPVLGESITSVSSQLATRRQDTRRASRPLRIQVGASFSASTRSAMLSTHSSPECGEQRPHWLSPRSATTNTNTSTPIDPWLCSPVRVPSARLVSQDGELCGSHSSHTLTTAEIEEGMVNPAMGCRGASPIVTACGDERDGGRLTPIATSECSPALSAEEECMVRLAASLWWMLPMLSVDADISSPPSAPSAPAHTTPDTVAPQSPVTLAPVMHIASPHTQIAMSTANSSDYATRSAEQSTGSEPAPHRHTTTAPPTPLLLAPIVTDMWRQASPHSLASPVDINSTTGATVSSPEQRASVDTRRHGMPPRLASETVRDRLALDPQASASLSLLAPFVARFIGLRRLPLHVVNRAAAMPASSTHAYKRFTTADASSVSQAVVAPARVSTEPTAAEKAPGRPPVLVPDATDVHRRHPRDADAYEDGEDEEEVMASCARTQRPHDRRSKTSKESERTAIDPGMVDLSGTATTTSAAIPSGEPTVRVICLEDVCFGFARPCILDIKMGSRQYGLNPSAIKKKSKEKKAAQSTSARHGLRLAGFKCWDDRTQSYVQKTKLQCRTLSLAELREDVYNFLRQDPVLRESFRAHVQQLLSAFSQQTAYRFYTSSLLFVYDAKYPVETSRIVMVDFAYTYQHAELIREGDADAKEERDEGYLVGLHTLLELLTVESESSREETKQ